MKNGGLRPEIANSNFNDERLSAFGAKAVLDICCSRRRSQRSSLKTVLLFSFCMQKPLFTLRVRAESPAHTGVTYSALTVVRSIFGEQIKRICFADINTPSVAGQGFGDKPLAGKQAQRR